MAGFGFLARVTARGRALVVNEGDGWWLYGVEPGGMAASGDTAPEVHIRFRQAFTKILFDVASEAQDYQEFEQRDRAFFHEVDDAEGARWEHALAALRSGKLVPEKPIDSLPRKSADTPVSVSVARGYSPAAFLSGLKGQGSGAREVEIRPGCSPFPLISGPRSLSSHSGFHWLLLIPVPAALGRVLESSG